MRLAARSNGSTRREHAMMAIARAISAPAPTPGSEPVSSAVITAAPAKTKEE
jgi:hypothetical protein